MQSDSLVGTVRQGRYVRHVRRASLPVIKPIFVGWTMRTPIPVLAPLGRLYDPLLQLAPRVHRVLAKRRKTIWADDRGSVFVNNSSLLPQISPRWIVGTYDID